MHPMQEIIPVLHNVRVLLHRNSLGKGGPFYARTSNEKTLTNEDIVTAMSTRGGYTGSYDDALEVIKLYALERTYQLCDGYAVSDGYTVIYPHVTGTFNSVNETPDPDKNKIDFRVRILSRLRRAIDKITIEIDGLAETNGNIDHLIDLEENDLMINQYIPEHVVGIFGKRIMVAGDSADNGVYFYSVDEPANKVKMTRIIENSPGRILGFAPGNSTGFNRIEIKTQYYGTKDNFLSAPKVLTSNFTVESM